MKNNLVQLLHPDIDLIFATEPVHQSWFPVETMRLAVPYVDSFPIQHLHSHQRVGLLKKITVLKVTDLMTETVTDQFQRLN